MRQTQQWVDADVAHVWHPFTQHGGWRDDEPIVVARAQGMHFWDTDGNRYIDGVSSLWVNVHGHAEPTINEAIKQQLDVLDHTTFLGLTHQPGIELAEELLAIAPAVEGERRLTRAFYAGDGASAVEAALKMAYQAQVQRGFPQRQAYLHIAEGYHGDTLGAVSVGGIELFHQTYRPIMLDTVMVSSPGLLDQGQDRRQRAEQVLAEVEAHLVSNPESISAIVIEPLVQAAGGMLTHDPEFVRGIRRLCDEHGCFMICDEVATGIGRTGRMWAVEHVDVVPDLITCGKGLTGGYLPLSAVLTTEEVFAAFVGGPERTFFHGHSYTGNPLCAAAAVANLRLMRERGTVEHAARVGRLMGEWLEPLANDVVEIRRIGTMTGIEIPSVGARTGFRVCQEARKHGVWIRPLGDVVVLMPPLAIPDDVLKELVDVTTAAIRMVLGGS